MSRRKQPQRDRARVWLMQALHCGEVTAEALRWQAARAGLSWRTVQRARTGIAETRKVRFVRGYWVWTKIATPESEERQQQGVCPVCGRWGRDRP